MSQRRNHKFIFVIGGVMSGVGKGIATSSIGKILQAKGFSVNPIKVDPYLNIDAGTMNPTEHGEVFVLNSGLECDQDMGNYERFLGVSLGNDDYITSGMVYSHVLSKERTLGYKGKCIEAIPHITDEIIRRFEKAAAANRSDVSLIEIGGTIGDFQNALFIEAARMMKMKHPDDVLFVIVSYLPIPSKIGEMKTKPTQNAVRQLNSYGVQPDIIIARSEYPLDRKRKEKLAVWCNVPAEHVVSAPDIESIYDVPVNFEHDFLGDIILKSLSINGRAYKTDLSDWKRFVRKTKTSPKEVRLAVVGKYFDSGDFVLSDAYISVIEALKFSAFNLNRKPILTWFNAKNFEKSNGSKIKLPDLKKYDGILVPGGFGETGVEGKIEAIRFARQNKIPYLGLCYGMQLAVVEYARNVLGLKGAHTTEINPVTKHPVIDVMPDQKGKIERGDMGGTMRLGAYPCALKKGTIAYAAYSGSDSKNYKLSTKNYKLVYERHRHRFEVNPEYIAKLSEGGLVFSGTSPDMRLMEIAELPRSVHPFFLGTQFHPEFQARPLHPHKLFTAFIKAAIKKRGASKK